MTWEYNAQRINESIKARRIMHKACRKIAVEYSPVVLPESVIKRICSRRKLYNFLEALELNKQAITAIFHAHNMSVPRYTNLRPAPVPRPEKKPSWLNRVNDDSDRDIFV